MNKKGAQKQKTKILNNGFSQAVVFYFAKVISRFSTLKMYDKYESERTRMPTYNIPGQDNFEIKTIILDLNGTLSIGGVVPDGVKERLDALKDKGFRITFFTGNTRNDANSLAANLGIEWHLAKNATDKRNLALALEPETCATIGNGLIDLELFKTVKLSIVTLQAEGVHMQTLMHADIVIPTINDALTLFIDEQRLVATLRK